MTQTLTTAAEAAANLKCGNCKGKGRRTYTLVTTEWAHDGRPASQSHIELDGKKISIKDKYSLDHALWMPCPTCGSKNVTINRVKGSYSEDKKCGARCRNATGGDCECTCAGEHHGVNNTAW